MQIENEKKKKAEEEAVPTEIEVQATRIQGEDGNVYMMISKQIRIFFMCILEIQNKIMC